MSAHQRSPLVAVTLPPDGSSPAAARRHVRVALRDAGRDAVLDDVLLLVTELVTNAVVHAGTTVSLRLVDDDDGLLVEVTDQSPGSTPVVRGDADSNREGGRGMFLLDALAVEWGTSHSRDRKSVWFRVGPSGPRALAEPHPPVVTEAVGEEVAPSLGWLLALPDGVEQRLSVSQVLTELLHRLGDALQVETSVLLVEGERDPDTWTVAAVRGTSPEADAVAELRRAAIEQSSAVTTTTGRTMVLLRGRGGPFGALVLDAGPLDGATVTVARLAAERLGMVLRDDRAEMAQRRQRGSLALLAEASDLFAATLDVELAVTLATQLVVPNLAQWSAVYAVSDRGVQLSAVAHADEDRTSALRVLLSSSAGTTFAHGLARELAVQRPAFVGRATLAEVLGDQRQGDVLALPLVARRRLLGGLLVARPPGGTYTAEDVSLLLDLARRAALAVDNARLYGERTAIARALQASLLPPELPAATAVDFWARYHPAGEGNEVGGDFYDVFAVGEDWVLVMGDVCGKGAEAAAVTALARYTIRAAAIHDPDPALVLRELNTAMLSQLDSSEPRRFVTVCCVHLTRGTEGVTVEVACGGHPLPLVLRADGTVEAVGRPGTLLGVMDEVSVETRRTVLAPGDALVTVTDGVLEARRQGGLFGDEGLASLLASLAGSDAGEISAAIESAALAQEGGLARDDIAVLVARVRPEL
jgi:phosphoserine phosphatase RsbU/P